MMIMTSQGLGEASGTSPLHANFTYSACELQCNALNRQEYLARLQTNNYLIARLFFWKS